MIADLNDAELDESVQHDVCVVGAGAAGICLALELARRGRGVTLLEGGGADVEDAEQEPYISEVVGRTHRGVHQGRFRAQGGTTTRWGGQILELNAEDFERRTWVQGGGWPFSKAALQPYYETALGYEGLAGVLREDRDVWRALHQECPTIAPLEPYFSRFCGQPNFARLHGAYLRGSDRIHVWLHANAVALQSDGASLKALTVRGRNGREYTLRAREFVFCMGSIECVRFFLQPRAAGLPWNASGLLGRHFQDHIDANLGTIVPRDRTVFDDYFNIAFLNGVRYHPNARLASAAQADDRTLNCAVTMQFLSDADETVAQVRGAAKKLLTGRLREVTWGDVREVARNLPLLARQTERMMRKHRVYNAPRTRVVLRAHCEQLPEGRSTITLSDQRDSLGLLRSRLDWQIAEQELSTLRTLAWRTREALAPIAELQVRPELLEPTSQAMLPYCDDSNHHMGGMRMSENAQQGVVNADLRLHGTTNGYVCSGAVFPSSGFSNPTHTVIALGMRLAEHLCRPLT